MKSIGQELKVDGVIWGGIFRYQNRKGTSYGVQDPASVSLDLHLLRVKDGAIVWRTQWAQTQKSLSEDLFQLGEVARRGLRWMTAEELAQVGSGGDVKELSRAPRSGMIRKTDPVGRTPDPLLP